MRQTWKDRRKQLYRGVPTPRVFTMALMLVVMGLIIVRARDPATWRWLSRDLDDEVQTVVGSEVADGKSPSKQPAPSAAPAPPIASDPGAKPKDSSQTAPELNPTGSTDLDPLESDDMKSNISFVKDGTLEMSKEEMPAYFRILGWVDHQPTELLRKRAHRDVKYADFRRTPDTMRLQIVELKLNVRQIVRCFGPPKNGKDAPITTPDGKQLYELCGFTQESGSNMYYGIVSDLPEGMPIGTLVNENVKLVGYFFKLQGYYSKQQQLEQEQTGKKQTMLKAPVIIGRAVWIIAPVEAEEKTPIWVLATIVGVAVVVIIGWVLMATRRSRPALPPVMSATVDSEGPGVDNWLDQAQSGRLSLEPIPETTASSDGAALSGGFGIRMSGNIFREDDESSNGHDGGENQGRPARGNENPGG
jgi:hypothetical protein